MEKKLQGCGNKQTETLICSVVLKALFVLAEIKRETEYEITFTHWNQKQNKKMSIKLSVFEI